MSINISSLHCFNDLIVIYYMNVLLLNHSHIVIYLDGIVDNAFLYLYFFFRVNAWNWRFRSKAYMFSCSVVYVAALYRE